MNILNRVTLQSLRRNRVRTTVTVVGVIISAAMFTAVTTLASSLTLHLKDTYIYNNGAYHISAEGVNAATVEELTADQRTDRLGLFKTVGYAVANTKNDYKPYVYIASVDSTAAELTPIKLISGRMPANPGELLIPMHLLSNGGVELKLGDTVTYSVGERVSEGSTLTQSNPFVPEEAEESLINAAVKTYTVVGIYERPAFELYSAPGYTAITFGESATLNSYGSTVFLTVKRPSASVDAYAAEHFADGCRLNLKVLMFEGYSVYDNITMFLVQMGSVFVFLIMLGSVSLIYSAFSISVSERTRQFGLLSSVGATKRQLRRAVLFEAGAVSAVGIPLGIASGIFGMWVTLLLCGDKFESIVSSPFKMQLRVSPTAIIAAAAISLLTVLISVMIPAKRATGVTAIEAIRQTRDIKPEKRTRGASRVFMRIFGLEGLLAKKYFARSKKKYRATVVSLALSVILFITSSTFCLYLKRFADEDINTYDFDVSVEGLSASAVSEKNLKLVKELASVDKALFGSKQYKDALCREDCFSAEHSKYLSLGNIVSEPTCSLLVYYISDSEFHELLKQNGLTAESDRFLKGGEGLLVNRVRRIEYVETENGYERKVYSFDYYKDDGSVTDIEFIKAYPEIEGYNYIDCRRGADGVQYLYYYDIEREEEPSFDEEFRPCGEGVLAVPAELESLGIGAFIEEPPIGLTELRDPVLVRPLSTLESDRADYLLFASAGDSAAAVKEIKTLLNASGFPVTDSMIFDYAQGERDTRNLITLINVFSYGFIVLISLISAACVFNTVSTNIMLRRKDFAMLRSVGMTGGGLNRMMNYECLLYGSRALLFGLPISLALSVVIHLMSSDSMLLADIELPWKSIGIAVLSVFAVVFVTMLYSMRKIKAEDPVTALKNENT